jgi:3',5'-cyclic AMP phosphodiesterase CpdA
LFTLLHISDLHRSPHDPIENASLLDALLTDKDRYLVETPKVGAPDAAIVSGDIIQGVTLNTPDYAAELDRQYGVAYDFLAQLAVRFFSGDHSRVVVVPGNHDVCWNTAYDAMTELTPEDPPIEAHAKLFMLPAICVGTGIPAPFLESPTPLDTSSDWTHIGVL